ncbi:ABC transporter permease [Shewanella sp. MBTL60-007]|uniref:ABC transporter permease n=1 Tax=Shewanella sp. MBTL60-007 TaxID=2815911 RepID=UPI001BC221D6|nr:ABC transporter permease [Shewanella sp. MBTL60-007]GIU22581.1 peptide ABC transporter permease [Shewanella sp. MBTL60-007]
MHSTLRKPSFIFASASLLLLVLFAFLWPFQGAELNLLHKYQAPSMAYLFGTDWLGRDLFSRSIQALAQSIYVGGLAVLMSSVLALTMAMFAMLHPCCRWLVDLLVDLFMSLPHLLLLILLSLAFGGAEWGLVIAIALSHWPKLTRLLRFEMQQVQSTPYYRLAEQFGCSPWQRLKTHMLPHILPQWWVGGLLLFPHALTHMAALTFLGFGLNPDSPSMGALLAQASQYVLTGHWWLGVCPGLLLLICLLLMSYIAQQLLVALRQGPQTHLKGVVSC